MNEEKTVPMWKVKLQIKMKQAKDKAFEYGGKAMKLMIDHPAQTLAFCSTCLGGAKLILGEKRRHDLKVAEQCRFYDRRTDTYHRSTRPLKPEENLIMERRYRNGELKSEVLRDLGLLKY